MRILLAQINPTVGDIQGNSLKIQQALANAQIKGADLVVFPELALTGYPPEDLLLLPYFIDSVEEAMKAIIACSKGIAAVVGT